MKRLLFVSILLLGIEIAGMAQNPAASFYRQHKRLEGVKNVKIPGWLVWFSSGIVHDVVKKEETKAMLKLARKVGKMRLMIAEDHNPIPVHAVSNLVTDARSTGYEDLVTVRDGETLLNIMGKIRKDKFKRLMIMVNEGNEFVFFEMKSRIKMKDITQLINLVMKNTPLEKQETPQPKRKQKSKDVPRV